MNTISQVLSELNTILKTISTTDSLGERVWSMPYEAAEIKDTVFPFAITSKMTGQRGEWVTKSFGVGKHSWEILVAVFLADGPIIPSNGEVATVEAMINSEEWYEKIAGLLAANMTINGTVDIIGNDEDRLFEYLTDNILWDGKQFYGHLFVIEVQQTVDHATSA